MKCLLTVVTEDRLEDGPIVTSPMGGPIVYDSVEEAGDAARALAANLRDGLKGVFVQKLTPVALYTPMSEATFPTSEPDPSTKVN